MPKPYLRLQYKRRKTLSTQIFCFSLTFLDKEVWSLKWSDRFFFKVTVPSEILLYVQEILSIFTQQVPYRNGQDFLDMQYDEFLCPKLKQGATAFTRVGINRQQYNTSMVLILDGNLETGANTKCNIWYLTCSWHLMRSKAGTIRFFKIRNPYFPSYVSNMFWVTIW